MIFLLASLWFVHPAPPEMPRAAAYLVKENGTLRLEDRFDVREMWAFQALLGRWEDDDGRFFSVVRFDAVPPLLSDTETKTRAAYRASRALPDKKDASLRDAAIARFSPFEMPEKPARPRQGIHGMKDVLYFEGTNTSGIVCAFLPEESAVWYAAIWTLAPGDDCAYARERFEDEFLRRWDDMKKRHLRSEIAFAPPKRKARAKKIPSERELLRADARHSVTNYLNWHVTDGDEFVVLDDIPSVNRFVVALTNDLKTMRAKYAETLPSPIDGSNVLALARIFRDRDEYLDAVGEELKWTAAYWSPLRRELVAYLPQEGAEGLMRTIRHEAFHQYLSYATSMLPVSPWLNEGYAQYFEDETSVDWNLPGIQLDFEKLAALIPPLLTMDDEAFYAGTDLERRLKYRLAWSLAVFIEKGAPVVRFQPFKNLKRDYIAALLKSRSPHDATDAAFVSRDRLAEFIAAWRKFWEE